MINTPMQFAATRARWAMVAGLGAILALGTAPGRVAAADPTPPQSIQHYNLGSDRLALKGYDAVAYFTTGTAVKGRKEIGFEHQGVRYQFASEQDRAAFAANPGKYLPAYGGWCATAMAKGEKVEVDPTNFKVTQGRLFLFFKAFYGNAIKEWNKDEAGQAAKADAHWHRISGE